MLRLVVLTALAVAIAPVAVAQELGAAELQIPDADSVTIPDLSGSGSAEVVANGWKYFFFRQEGISYAEAYADFHDCYRFMAPAGWADIRVPNYVPWEGKAARKSIYTPNPYGIVGALIGSMIEGTLVRRDYQAKMRRCMETRGYTRYGVAEEIWENVRALPAQESLAIQAKIASGPDFGGKVPEK